MEKKSVGHITVPKLLIRCVEIMVVACGAREIENSRCAINVQRKRRIKMDNFIKEIRFDPYCVFCEHYDTASVLATRISSTRLVALATAYGITVNKAEENSNG